MRYAYPALLTPEEEGGFSVSFPDVPEALTQGDDETEALDMARDALVAALSFYVDRGDALPAPSAVDGGRLVPVPALAAAKLALHAAKVEQGISNSELGRRLGKDEKEVRRLLDPTHGSRFEVLEAALAALGRQVVLEVDAAA
ncbi:type II toxin-antitoxin system HicB family antitoxin [Pararoseomonas indoligenes]|uniref:Type II toxin-antitoxin system HicB family antitoxin n=1 Tax=Roseomonas indoligenes TaxID=2820811 RepID=A0A940MRV0_9PROT|nr:type II toxin-antitoxin system HicB family antitoxin [Pararoseomonas indoligenes]MBP0492888.1 type II toxin-antitoxin system HicB family antitoxin [Pararoseomonas indoligenes]